MAWYEHNEIFDDLKWIEGRGTLRYDRKTEIPPFSFSRLPYADVPPSTSMQRVRQCFIERRGRIVDAFA